MAFGLLWKKTGIGSQDALGQLKRDLGLPGKSREGIGHTGVLDPFAEGWLLVGTEEGTKLLSPLSGLDKTYEAEMLIGWTTTTLDSTGEVQKPEGQTAKAVFEWLDRDLSEIEKDLRELLAAKSGTSFDQIPPQFSAVHVDGKRAYDWARKGVEKELKAKRVELHGAEHVGLRRGPENSVLWTLRVHVSSGTYIRAFARDWAQEIAHFPGHLTGLIRVAVGEFGRNEDPKPWKLLGPESLKGLFDFHSLTESEAQRLRNYGDWKPRPHPRPCLLVGPGELGTIAWTEAGSGKVGRVFRSDPFL